MDRSTRILANCLQLVPGFLLFIAVLAVACEGRSSFATDYFVTIGGGYNPSGNQASLEANVLFFQKVLTEKHRGERVHDVFFADGFDKSFDVQILSEKVESKTPATDLIASLHRRGPSRGAERVEYRDHVVPNIKGPTNPEMIHASISRIAQSAHKGDRMFVYVTSHGSEGAKGDLHNTTIDCWNDKDITVREFSGWLAEVPADVPVVMVMAQCYCGGFALTIFEDFKVPDDDKKPARQIRIGFFAQQHNLTAAGCRPDIDNDEEFSSYFWGAIVGRSRTGQVIDGCDIDGNGTISFAEANAYAVVASNTIDIPLQSSEVLLRTYSRLSNSDDAKSDRAETDTPGVLSEPESEGNEIEKPVLFTRSGTIESLLDQQTLVTKSIVTGLCKALDLSLQEDVTAVDAAYEKLRAERRSAGRGPRRRSGSGRRELLQEVTEKWPDLGEEQDWSKSPLLAADNQATLLTEIKQLSTYETFEKNRRLREEQSVKSEQSELREVKFRRLINTLEVIILSKNLRLVASEEIVQRYRDMLSLEESSL